MPKFTGSSSSIVKIFEVGQNKVSENIALGSEKNNTKNHLLELHQDYESNIDWTC